MTKSSPKLPVIFLYLLFQKKEDFRLIGGTFNHFMWQEYLRSTPVTLQTKPILEYFSGRSRQRMDAEWLDEILPDNRVREYRPISNLFVSFLYWYIHIENFWIFWYRNIIHGIRLFSENEDNSSDSIIEEFTQNSAGNLSH